MTRTIDGGGAGTIGPVPPRDEAADSGAAPPAPTAMLRRLRRIEGQVRGLERMVEAGRDGVELLMQIASVREALQGAATIILEAYIAGNAEAIMLAGDEIERRRILARTVEVFKTWAT